jgi:hypothetical protein
MAPEGQEGAGTSEDDRMRETAKAEEKLVRMNRHRNRL